MHVLEEPKSSMVYKSEVWETSLMKCFPHTVVFASSERKQWAEVERHDQMTSTKQGLRAKVSWEQPDS